MARYIGIEGFAFAFYTATECRNKAVCHSAGRRNPEFSGSQNI